MGKFLIVYATRADETKSIAELIAEGIRISGNDVVLKKINEISSEDDIKGYDGYAFGSATYHGEMVASMKQFLFIAERAELKGKAGGAFGAYGWSGEAPGRIYETMKNIYGMKMVSDALMLKASWIEGGKQAAQDYGKSIVSLI
jgi:flavorubredoxin